MNKIQNPKNRIYINQTFEKQNLPEITYTPFTMSKNIITSKATIGLLNTLNSKTGTVLNPQAEFIATNAKIK